MNITTKFDLKQDAVFLRNDRIAEGQVSNIVTETYFTRDGELISRILYDVRPYHMRIAGGFIAPSDALPYKELQTDLIRIAESQLFATRMDLSQFLLTAPLP
jgi:hypothetical protein